MPKVQSSAVVSAGKQCTECGAIANRSVDLARHMKTHAQDKSDISYHCYYPGCTFKALQKSNFQTHIRTHTGEKHKQCPDCDYSTGDPSCLLRHRKRLHGYVPRQHGGNRRNKAKVELTTSTFDITSSSCSSFLPPLPTLEQRDWLNLNPDFYMGLDSELLRRSPSPKQTHPALYVPQLQNIDEWSTVSMGYPPLYPGNSSLEMNTWIPFANNVAYTSPASSASSLGASSMPELDMSSWFVEPMPVADYSWPLPAQPPVADNWDAFVTSTNASFVNL